MATDKTKQKAQNTKEPEKKPAAKKPVKKVLVPLDENMLWLSAELFKNISPLSMEITKHENRKTLIINQDELNSFLTTNIKLAQLNEIKKMQFNIMDNDFIEIELELVNFNGTVTLIKEVKIVNAYFNAEDGFFQFEITDDNNTKGYFAISQIMLLVSKYIVRQILLPSVQKSLKEDDMKLDKQMISINLKEGAFKYFYDKTINQVLNTSVPFFGHKHLTDILEVESIMCEKGQLWIDIIYKIE